MCSDYQHHAAMPLMALGPPLVLGDNTRTGTGMGWGQGRDNGDETGTGMGRPSLDNGMRIGMD